MKKTGFTLIELMVVVVILSVMVGFLSWVFIVGLRTWGSGKDRAEIRQRGNLGLERIVRDLSQAGSITAAGASSITFTADTNADGSNEIVTFAYDAANTKIDRTVNGTTTTLMPYVQAFGLSYCQAYTETTFTPVSQADRDAIRIIKVSLTMDKADETVTLGSSAYPRNQGS